MTIYLMNCLKVTFSLVEILMGKIDISGIISLKVDNNRNRELFDYSSFYKEKEIDCIELRDYSINNSQDVNALKKKEIDLLIICGWQRLIPDWLINHCKLGVIGCHGSSEGITKGRGRSPQNWALITGARRFEVSIFWIDSSIDSGKIISSRGFELNDSDDIVVSYEKVSISVADMIVENINNGNIENRFGLNQNGTPFYLPKRIREDGMIDWNRRGKDIYNFVRALTLPYPCAFTLYEGIVLDIIDCKYIETSSEFLREFECGVVVLVQQDGYPWVKCKDGIVEIRNYNSDINIKINKGMKFKSGNFHDQIKRIIERHGQEMQLTISSIITNLLNE